MADLERVLMQGRGFGGRSVIRFMTSTGVGVDFKECRGAALRWRSDEVSQLSEVPPDGGLYEVGDAGVAVLAALYDLLYLFCEGLGKVDFFIIRNYVSFL